VEVGGWMRVEGEEEGLTVSLNRVDDTLEH
jgi:hypothetical protein